MRAPSDDGYFDEDIAARYDADLDARDRAVVEPMVAVLAEYAGDAAALEFAIGTGRVALPLRARGVPVSGIDLSAAMVRRLRAKSGGGEIPIIIGDMASVRMDGEFGVVYLVFNTIMNITTQAGQVACFQNAAAHLPAGGCFVVEVMVPQLRRLPVGERLVAWDLSARHWGVDEYDPVNQRLVSHHLHADGAGPARIGSMPFRYVWPAELDLMAELAAMTLVARWEDWQRQPFTADSPSHVSIWRKT